jgi:RNA polymerase sigma-70 factor (ECF subfamily)
MGPANGGPPASVEERVTAALSRGDGDGATAEALKGYGPEILRYTLILCRTPDDARDVFSEFAVRLWKALRTFRGETTVRAYAYRLARHAAADFYAAGFRRRRATLSSGLVSQLAESIHSSSKASLERKADRFAGVRATLTPDEEALLVLRIDRKLSWDEVAHALGDDERTVDAVALRKRFERLKEKIARKVGRAE